ncbi:hypothetical protein ScPMuIL_014464 [Solemya velum]
MASGKLLSVDYEVFGRVQGVFFRKFTKDTANAQGCVGWVMNTCDDTVKGVVQGSTEKVENMMHWLSKVGSPMSRISKCEFHNKREIPKLEYTKFAVKSSGW